MALGSTLKDALRRRAARTRTRLVEAAVVPFTRVLLPRVLEELDKNPEASMIRAIANDARMRDPLFYHYPDRVKIAPTATVHNASFNTGSGSIEIHDNVIFGGDVHLICGKHDVSKTGEARIHDYVPYGFDIVVEEGAWIATRATILGPCRIGRDAVVAACAVVNKDVPPGAIVAGIPARVIGHIDKGRAEAAVTNGEQPG